MFCRAHLSKLLIHTPCPSKRRTAAAAQARTLHSLQRRTKSQVPRGHVAFRDRSLYGMSIGRLLFRRPTGNYAFTHNTRRACFQLTARYDTSSRSLSLSLLLVARQRHISCEACCLSSHYNICERFFVALACSSCAQVSESLFSAGNSSRVTFCVLGGEVDANGATGRVIRCGCGNMK